MPLDIFTALAYGLCRSSAVPIRPTFFRALALQDHLFLVVQGLGATSDGHIPTLFFLEPLTRGDGERLRRTWRTPAFPSGIGQSKTRRQAEIAIPHIAPFDFLWESRLGSSPGGSAIFVTVIWVDVGKEPYLSELPVDNW